MSSKTSVHALIRNNERIFLTQRRDVPLWVMPGGTVETGETLEEALVREVKEETGYDLGDLKQLLMTKLGDTQKYIYSAKIISACRGLIGRKLEVLDGKILLSYRHRYPYLKKIELLKLHRFLGILYSKKVE